jgi:hypothetical protein
MRSILIALAVWAFALAAPQAASATGARVDNTQCFPSSIGSGYTACFTTKGATNETATPSGNVNYQFNGTVTFTIADPTGQVVYQSTHERHDQRLVQDGVVRAEGQHVSDTFPLNGKTCRFQSDFQYANGEVRYSNFQSSCS